MARDARCPPPSDFIDWNYRNGNGGVRKEAPAHA